MQPEVEYLTAWFLTSQLFDAVRYHIQRDRDLRNSYFCGDPIDLSNTIQVASRFGGGRAARRPSSKPIQLRTGEAVFMIVEGAARNQLENVRHMPLKRPIANASEQSHILCETGHPFSTTFSYRQACPPRFRAIQRSLTVREPACLGGAGPQIVRSNRLTLASIRPSTHLYRFRTNPRPDCGAPQV